MDATCCLAVVLALFSLVHSSSTAASSKFRPSDVSSSVEGVAGQYHLRDVLTRDTRSASGEDEGVAPQKTGFKAWLVRVFQKVFKSSDDGAETEAVGGRDDASSSDSYGPSLVGRFFHWLVSLFVQRQRGTATPPGVNREQPGVDRSTVSVEEESTSYSEQPEGGEELGEPDRTVVADDWERK